MYTKINYPTKKALKEAIKAGRNVRLQPNFIGRTPTDGIAWVEGPHGNHKWYAQVTLKNGKVISAA